MSPALDLAIYLSMFVFFGLLGMGLAALFTLPGRYFPGGDPLAALGRLPRPLATIAQLGLWLWLAWAAVDLMWHGPRSLYFSFFWWANFFPHEAGHAVFRPLGEYLYFLGGTFWQLATPLLVMILLWIKGYRPVWLLLCLFWFGESLLDVAVYVADASARNLALLPPGATHDWWYLLGERGLLGLDWLVAGAARFMGAGAMAAAVCLGFYAALTVPRPRSSPRRL